MAGDSDGGRFSPLQRALHCVGWRADDVSLATRIAVVQALLNAGASLAADEDDGVTCIHVAAWRWARKSSPELRALAKRLCATAGPALLDAGDQYGRTPLHEAAEARNWFGLTLLEAGASCSVFDNKGFTPADIAATYGHVELLGALLDRIEGSLEPVDVDYLLQCAILEAPRMDNTSDAALCRRLDVLEELFSRPRIRELALAPSQDGRTFLFYMAQWGGLPMRRCEVFDAVIQAAQELGMDVNHQDPNGDTVLHVAMRAVARRGLDDKEFIQRWIWAGARPSIPNASGLRAFDVLGDPARRKCHFSLNALHYGEMQEAAPPRETRGQRYVRRHGDAASAAELPSGRPRRRRQPEAAPAGSQSGREQAPAGAAAAAGSAAAGAELPGQQRAWAGPSQQAAAAVEAPAVLPAPFPKRQRVVAATPPAAATTVPAAGGAAVGKPTAQPPVPPAAAPIVQQSAQPGPAEVRPVQQMPAAAAAQSMPPAAVAAQLPQASAAAGAQRPPAAGAPPLQQAPATGAAAAPATAMLAATPAAQHPAAADPVSAAVSIRQLSAPAAPKPPIAAAAAMPATVAVVAPAQQPCAAAAASSAAAQQQQQQQQPLPAAISEQQPPLPAATPEQQQPPPAAAPEQQRQAAPAAPQPAAAVPPRQQLVRILQQCTEAGALDSKAALLYRFQFGRMSAGRQAEELQILAGLEAEGALAEVGSCVRLAVADAAAAAQQ